MKYSSDRYPNPGDSCTVCETEFYKKASLLYDRIYVSPGIHENLNIPASVTFGFKSAERHFQKILEEGAVRLAAKQFPPGTRKTSDMLYWLARKQGDRPAPISYIFKRAVSKSYRIEGVGVTPSFALYSSFVKEFNNGTELGVEAALNNIKIINDSKASWTQILDFRKDEESIRKYRDLRLWLKESLSASSIQEASDIIGQKLEDYEWALTKHGFSTVQNAITYVLNYKQAGVATMAGVAGSYFAGPLGSMFASGVVIVGQVTAWTMNRYIEKEDVKRGPGREVAYIQDINERFTFKD
ncbi:hypothetical protein [Desulfogranum marinum]|uniref:hypothetical protein n=1 Tax=Desulfogranum marinum TaxID=453220 RepID=UPI0029C65B61|nr:hypothetical protein [Desulfogranum marinum]